MNLEALNKTIALMEKDVAETGIDFDLGKWLLQRDDPWDKLADNGKFKNHECKTVACIAGYTVLANDKPSNRTSTSTHALKILKMREDQFDILTNPGFTGLPEGKDYHTITKQDALKVLRHLRHTGRVDWSVIGEEQGS